MGAVFESRLSRSNQPDYDPDMSERASVLTADR